MNEFKGIARRVVCADGASLSVQASHGHYCIPRDNVGPYTRVEVGFPSAKPPATWAEYFDGEDGSFDSKWGEGVYAYVPTELVAEYIASHGGVCVSWLTGGAEKAK